VAASSRDPRRGRGSRGARVHAFQLRRIAVDAGATWRRGELVSVDVRAHLAYTTCGEALPYDLLVVAAGARPHVTLLGALTFRGEHDEPAFRALVGELRTGAVGSLAFVVPPGPGWPLPLYELALRTAAELPHRRSRLVLVTPETAPLERFEAEVSLLLGADDVYAIGDATSFPLKHGAIAVQQADAAAESVAARLGMPLRPAPFRPVLLTGETSTAAYRPLWWPPSSVAGGRLASYLASYGLPVPPPPTGAERLPVELELPVSETAATVLTATA
jgi:sulfide:quinone oxidoreductase